MEKRNSSGTVERHSKKMTKLKTIKKLNQLMSNENINLMLKEIQRPYKKSKINGENKK